MENASPGPGRWRRLLVNPFRPMTAARFGMLAGLGALPLVGLTVAMGTVPPQADAYHRLEAWRGCFGWLYAGWMGFLLQARFRYLPQSQEIAIEFHRMADDIDAIAERVRQGEPSPQGKPRDFEVIPGLSGVLEATLRRARVLGVHVPASASKALAALKHEWFNEESLPAFDPSSLATELQFASLHLMLASYGTRR